MQLSFATATNDCSHLPKNGAGYWLTASPKRWMSSHYEWRSLNEWKTTNICMSFMNRFFQVFAYNSPFQQLITLFWCISSAARRGRKYEPTISLPSDRSNFCAEFKERESGNRKLRYDRIVWFCVRIGKEEHWIFVTANSLQCHIDAYVTCDTHIELMMSVELMSL